MEIRAIVLSQKDNVAVLTEHAQAGDTAMMPNDFLLVQETIPTGHKMAICSISAGEGIYKYGVVIGRAKQDIAAGEWVHTHNVEDITEQICNEYAARYRARAKEARKHGQRSWI